MGKPKKKHKKAKQLPLSKEEQIYQAARDLAAEIGISYSEALGFTLGINLHGSGVPLLHRVPSKAPFLLPSWLPHTDSSVYFFVLSY